MIQPGLSNNGCLCDGEVENTIPLIIDSMADMRTMHLAMSTGYTTGRKWTKPAWNQLRNSRCLFWFLCMSLYDMN